MHVHVQGTRSGRVYTKVSVSDLIAPSAMSKLFLKLPFNAGNQTNIIYAFISLMIKRINMFPLLPHFCMFVYISFILLESVGVT